MADEVARLDDGLAASDWNRGRSWDLWVRESGDLVLVTTPAQMDLVLGDLGMSLEAFMELPSARAMPAELRDALEAAGRIG